MWFQDEARIGQKNSLTRVWGQTGSRPAAPKDLGFASAYVFGAVCPLEGKAAALIMPICNTAAMNHHLCEISSQVAADVHAVVILDGASWHKSHGLVTPSNITLLALPPYSPELNPVERIWHYLRSHWLANYKIGDGFVGSSELGPIYRRTRHPSSCRRRHTDRVVERRSEEPPLTAADQAASHHGSAVGGASASRNRRFESAFLQSRVRCEPDFFGCEDARHQG